jgi:hypothetical protein
MMNLLSIQKLKLNRTRLKSNINRVQAATRDASPQIKLALQKHLPKSPAITQQNENVVG